MNTTDQELPWNDPKDPAAIICRFADKKGTFIPDALEVYKKEFRKTKIKITPEIIARAQTLERQRDAHARYRIERLNKVWNLKLANNSTTLIALLTGRKVSELLKPKKSSKKKRSKT